MIPRTFSFIAARKKMYALSSGLFVILLAVTFAVHGGFKFGLDFVGGTSVIVKFDQPADLALLTRIREVLEPKGLAGSIRTVTEVGGSSAEAREVSIDVRGSGWVDEQVVRFKALQTGSGAGLTSESIRTTFAPFFAPEALDDLIANFTPPEGDSTAVALYDPARATEGDLREIFQSLFNENISLTVSTTLKDAFVPASGAKRFDINSVEDGRALAEALATLRIESLEKQIADAMPPDSPRPWTTSAEFLTALGLDVLDAPEARKVLRGRADPAIAEAKTSDAVMIDSATPATISALFRGAFIRRFLRSAEIVCDYRTRDHGGIYADAATAARTIATSDPEAASSIAENFHAGRFIIASSETVGPTVGADLKEDAIWSVILSILGILAYVAVRFDLRFGVGSIVALIHDTLMTIAFIGAMGMEFSIPIVAAILTIIGYSINDTIVLFDRIREKIGSSKAAPSGPIIDLAIHETMSRTIATSFTVFIAVLAFLFFGPVAIRDLNVTLTFGLIVGSYSTIFIAAPFLLEWEAWLTQRKPKNKSTK